MVCHDGECKNYKAYFTDFEGDITLEESLIHLCITPFLYFGMLAVLEHQLIQKLIFRMKKISLSDYRNDEQVDKEKADIVQRISVLKKRKDNFVNDFECYTIELRLSNAARSRFRETKYIICS